MFTRRLITQTFIDAPPEAVWNALIEFNSYPDWNPFITSVDGRAEVGTRLRIHAQLSEKRSMKFSPTILTLIPTRDLHWRGRLILPGIFDGTHRFQLETISTDRTRFIQSEEFSGILVPVIWSFISADTERGFHRMNEALKSRVERRESGS